MLESLPKPAAAKLIANRSARRAKFGMSLFVLLAGSYTRKAAFIEK
jgi:hypothetical protein